MNDKHDEPPQVPEGYGISVAYACLIDAVRAIHIEISPDIYQPTTLLPQLSNMAVSSNSNSNETHSHPMNRQVAPPTTEDNNDDQDSEQQLTIGAKKLHEQIISSSWHGLLTAFCPLIESWYVIFSFNIIL